jgi:hypothetical protein
MASHGSPVRVRKAVQQLPGVVGMGLSSWCRACHAEAARRTRLRAEKVTGRCEAPSAPGSCGQPPVEH